MDFQQFKELVAQAAKEMGIAEYELYYQAGQSVSIGAFQKEINNFSASSEGGVCFRCIVDGKMGYASTEALNAQQAASIVARAADNARTLEAEEPVFLGAGGKTYTPIDRVPYAMPSTAQLREKVLTTQEALYQADPAVVDGCHTTGIAETLTVDIFNSKGLDLHYENTLSGLVVAAVVSDGQEKANDYQIKLGALDQLDHETLTKKAAQAAIRKLGGDPAPTAVCPVVFDPEAMSDLLSTFSGIFSSEYAQKGLSRLGGKEGTMVASPVVTLLDDPFHPENPMPMNFDAEGSPTFRKAIIQDGKLQTLLYNLKTAAVAGCATTGNASKAGYDAPVAVRPFTMYIEGGSCTEEELLQEAGNGVYINSLSGLHAGANPISGDFSLQSAGFLIENGVKTVPVKSFTVAGNFYELLEKITRVASNVTLPGATGSTAFGSPSVLVRDLSIAGK